MTCIVGLVDRGKVWVGGDSSGIDGWELTPRADPKVFRNGDFAIGFTSSFRMGQLLRYVFQPPKREKEKDVFAYMVQDFVPAIRQCLKDGGYVRGNDGREEGGSFLVGYAGRLFLVDSDFQVEESLHPFNACGSGAQVALGALYATPQMKPHSRLHYVLEAAETFNAGVRHPFTVIHTPEGS